MQPIEYNYWAKFTWIVAESTDIFRTNYPTFGGDTWITGSVNIYKR